MSHGKSVLWLMSTYQVDIYLEYYNMPYISRQRRIPLDEWKHNSATGPGELNYRLSVVIKQYLGTHGRKYSTMNDIMGALEGAKLEFYRKTVVPYEEEKIIENGDIE